MNIVCLDLEVVLVPEIWIAFAKESGIPELTKTTRDEPDYDKLMTWRRGILKEHGLGLTEIQNTIAKIDPIPGAKEFLDELRSQTQVIIISDTFEQFATPLMKKLGLATGSQTKEIKYPIIGDEVLEILVRLALSVYPETQTEQNPLFQFSFLDNASLINKLKSIKFTEKWTISQLGNNIKIEIIS